MDGNHYLLDTHSLIWFQESNIQIPDRIMKIMRDPLNVILFSQVSLFEIAIKLKIGKLPAFYATVEEIYQQAIDDGFTFITIQNGHIYTYNKIPLMADHRDPFDRLLIATAIKESAIILSADEKFNSYKELVGVMW